MEKNNLTALFKKKRKEKKLKQIDMSKMLNVSRQYYSMLEIGERKTKDKIFKICEILGIDFFNSKEVEEFLKVGRK